MESHDPRRPKPDDDAAPGLPAIDGADADAAFETKVDLDVGDDEASELDDHVSPDLEGPLDEEIQEDGSVVADDEDVLAPVGADPSLAEGEGERWTEGSDASEDTPWQEAPAVETGESSVDRGEEGFDDLAGGAGDALPGLPPARSGEDDDDDADELDVSEDSTLETTRAEADEGVPALPRIAVPTRWHGPPREAARALAIDARGVLVAARGLWRIADGTRALGLPFETEVSSVLARPGASWIANDAGEVWTEAEDSFTRHARPGTDDASVGGLELFAIGDVVVALTRGGAVFRSSGDAWTGPIVAKNVRRVRIGLDGGWLALVVGSAAAPELLATRDARTFERVRGPEGEIIADASRAADVVAVASGGGRLFVSKDAGASYAVVPDVIDVERVWARRDGTVLAATFHEATDHGRLVRVNGARAEVVLDMAAEVGTRRLMGPGEQDGDGHIHAVLGVRSTLWVATGVGVFELALGPDQE